MGGGKWAVMAAAVAFTLIIYLPSSLYFRHSNHLQPPFMRQLKSMLLTLLQEGDWRTKNTGNKIAELKNEEKMAISPNLTSCHPSYGRKDLLVNCCPPNYQTPQPFIDFQFPDPSRPVRVRRPIHIIEKDETYVAKYKKAISIMKSLPYDDPRNWMRQANLHCLFCTGAYNQPLSHFPFQVHGSWLFFPWHRMMLYFHERILGSLIGDDTFTLPYWPWDIPEGMEIPALYMNQPFFDAERDISHFPPRKVDLNFNDVEHGFQDEQQIDYNMAVMYTQMVSAAKKTELFMGCNLTAGQEGYCHVHGTLELAPHNTMHTWVGSSLNPRREDMGVFYSAARDPIFYVHHSNIDRLWEVWRQLNHNKLDIKDSAWLDSYFFFYDENLQLVRIRICDVLNITKLGYIYEKSYLPWLNARPKPSIPPKLARQILTNMSTNHYPSITDFIPYGKPLNNSLTLKVKRPKIFRTKKEKEAEEEVIVVYGINVKQDEYVKFDVYVNAIDHTVASPQFREFAGTFVHVPRGISFHKREGYEMTKKKDTLKLGISELLEDLEADADESIWITLLPRTKTCTNVTIDGIRIEYMK